MASLTQRHILVVDDEPSVRSCLAMLLRSVGYEVAVAEDGLEALLLMNESAPDILVSDLNMPRMSGFDLLSEVRRRFPHTLTIAMSGAYREGSELPPEVLAHGFYSKSDSSRNLCETLAHLLEGIPAPSA